MAVPLTKYIKIKDKYCIAYLGNDQHTVDELVRNKPKLEALCPGVYIYICAQEKLLNKHSYGLGFEGYFLIPVSRLDKSQFPYIREINEVEEFLQESGLGV